MPGPDEPETLNDGQGSDGEVVEPRLPPDLDRDEDGVPDDVDNCDEHANPNQNNADQDGRGDACDVCVDDAANDKDSDTVCGAIDNCPKVSNPQ